MLDYCMYVVCVFQQLLLKMAEQSGHASSETITVTLLNIRNLVSFVDLDLLLLVLMHNIFDFSEIAKI